jgi:hypothetical protein
MGPKLSSLTIEYIVFFLYLFLLIAYGIVESVWVRRIVTTSRPKSLFFTLFTNFLGWCVGVSLLFVSVGVTLALAWDGSMEKLPYKGNETIGLLVLLIVLLPAILMLIKRVGLGFFKVTTKAAWKFSLFSSVLFWIVPVVITFLVGWLMFRFRI